MGNYREKLKASPYPIEPCKQVRVILDTDCAAEIDDSYAIVYALLSPKLDVRAICAEHVGIHGSAVDSYRVAMELLGIMGLEGEVPVFNGRVPLKDENDCELSDAAQFIIDEALRDDPRPLFIAGQGALTNVAVAIGACPEIQKKITLVWAGGGAYPEGGWELNSLNDYIAANRVMESNLPVWQIPLNVVAQSEIPVITLFEKLRKCGKLGHYLYEQTLKCMERLTAVITKETSEAMPPFLISPHLLTCYYPSGEYWQIGDCGIISRILALAPNEFEMMGAPLFDAKRGGCYILRPENPRKILVIKGLRQNILFQDVFGKMEYYFGEK